ncbi:FAD-dependent oxidoreductase, partial [Candidatus Bipolaricaulota bacterium]|nr:FAD-dependent oxidoreductase [Candidatus Bipolaricaulota bacterium]
NIGHIPDTDFLKGTVALDEQGYVITDDRLRTNLSGVFAAGDVRIGTSRYAQAVIAAGDGAIAAIEVEKYLS